MNKFSEATPLLKVRDVLRIVPVCRSSLYALIERNEFPKPLKIGKRMYAWHASQIEEWLRSREE